MCCRSLPLLCGRTGLFLFVRPGLVLPVAPVLDPVARSVPGGLSTPPRTGALTPAVLGLSCAGGLFWGLSRPVGRLGLGPLSPGRRRPPCTLRHGGGRLPLGPRPLVVAPAWR